MPPKEGKGPPAKKAKTAAKPRAKRPAKLESFAALPLDILADICAHFDGSTLLSLSRTTKSLREFLYAGSSLVIWKRARIAAGLPELRSGLDEIRYATMLCGKKGISKIDYNSRARVCPACARDTIRTSSQLCYETNLHGYAHALECVPSRDYKDSENFLPLPEYFLPLLEPINARLFALQSSGQQTQDYRLKMMQRAQVWNADGEMLLRWAHDAKNKAEAIKRDSREARRTEIERRFRALGDWNHKDFAGEWRQQSYVNDPKPLTERTWKNALPILEKWLTESRRARLEKERIAEVHRRQASVRQYCALLRNPYQSDASQPTVPPMNVFMLLESVKGFWQIEEDWHALTDRELRTSMMATQKEVLGEIVEYNARSKLNLYRRCLDVGQRWGKWLASKLEDESCFLDRARRAQYLSEGDKEGIKREKDKGRVTARQNGTRARGVVSQAPGAVGFVDLLDAESDYGEMDDSDGEEEDDEMTIDPALAVTVPPSPSPAPALSPVPVPTSAPASASVVDHPPPASPADPSTIPTDAEMDELLLRQPALFRCARAEYPCERFLTYSEILSDQHTCLNTCLDTLVQSFCSSSETTPSISLSDDLYFVDEMVWLAHSACVDAMDELFQATLEEKIQATQGFRLTCVDCALRPVDYGTTSCFTYHGFMEHLSYCHRDQSLPFHVVLSPALADD